MEFGQFIKNKRKEKDINLRKLASLIGIAPAYMSDIENGKRNAPSKEIMEKIIQVLELEENEQNEMYDIAANEKENTVAPDISEYIKSSSHLRMALRKAKDLNIDDEEWVKIMKEIIEMKEEDKIDIQ